MTFIVLQIVNFGPVAVNISLSTTRLEAGINTMKSRVTVLTSSNVMDENSFSSPNKVRGRLVLQPRPILLYIQ